MNKWLFWVVGLVAAPVILATVADRSTTATGLSAKEERIVEAGLRKAIHTSAPIIFYNLGTVDRATDFRLVCGEFDGRAAFGMAADPVAFMGTLDSNEGRFVAVKLGITTADRGTMISKCDSRGVIRNSRTLQ